MQDPATIEAHKKAGLSMDFKDDKQLGQLLKDQEVFAKDVISKLYK